MARRLSRTQQASQQPLPIGATHFLNSEGNLTRIPEGIRIRSKRGVQIEFTYQGRRYTETLPGLPTDEAVSRAIVKKQSVEGDILFNRFVYENAFPLSRKFRQSPTTVFAPESHKADTMGKLLEDFLDIYRSNNPNSHNTISDYEQIIKSRLAPSFHEMDPKEVTKKFIIDYRTKLLSTPLSEKRVSNILTPLRGAMALAVERDLIVRNPFHGVTPTKSRKRKKVHLDEDGEPLFDEELPLFLDPKLDEMAKAADPLDSAERTAVLLEMHGQVRNFFMFNFWSGLRSGEMIALRWCDVDLKNKRILVRLSWSRKVFTTTKGRRARWVDLTEPAMHALLAQFEITGHLGRWVFHNPRINDRWQNTERIRQVWMAALNRAGVRYRKPYQARHTYASAMVSAGERPEYVAAQMGHEDTSMVALVYARWVKSPDFTPGSSAAVVYKKEWANAATLVERENIMPELADFQESSSENEDGDEDEGEF